MDKIKQDMETMRRTQTLKVLQIFASYVSIISFGLMAEHHYMNGPRSPIIRGSFALISAIIAYWLKRVLEWRKYP